MDLRNIQKFYQWLSDGDKIQFYILIVLIITAVCAGWAGISQYKINKNIYDASIYSEIFVYQSGWWMRVENAGNTPVYLLNYTINGKEEEIGETVLPKNPQQHYDLHLLNNYIMKNISVDLFFNDQINRTFKSTIIARWNGNETVASWWFDTHKKQEIK